MKCITSFRLEQRIMEQPSINIVREEILGVLRATLILLVGIIFSFRGA